MTKASDKELLDRETIDRFVNEKLSPTITLLREIVDYGVHLLNKCGHQGGSLSDLVITGHFFKHAVTMLDAVEIQLSRGAVFAAGVSARSMLEAYLYLEWLLKSDTEKRARQFYVWHLRQKRSWTRRAIPGTSEYNRFQKHLDILSDMKDTAKRKAIEASARKQDEDLVSILTNQKNKPINDEFDKLKKKHFDVAWYCPGGPNSIADMASRLNLESEYEFFYSQFSDITHVGAFDKHVKFDGKAVIFEPLRSPESIDTVVNVVASLAFRLFRLIINKYFPKEIKTFTHNYISQWRTPFLSIPKVVIKAQKRENPQQITPADGNSHR
jgi:hypothetical protein